MSELEYSWQDIQPVQALVFTILGVQTVGAAVSLWMAPFPGWFDNLWVGAALCTFPGFLTGLPIQARARAHSLQENKALVGKMGLLALGLTVASIVFPEVGLIHAP